MENKKIQTTIAYRCPTCGAGVMSMVDAFKLGAPMVKLKCACGESELVIENQSDEKVKITAPCILCPKPHSFTVSKEAFFGKDEFSLCCPYSEMSVCFIGDIDYVKADLAKNELELLDAMEKSGVTDLETFREANRNDGLDALDSEVLQSILFVLSELEAEQKIFCKCEHTSEIDSEKYGYEVTAEGIVVQCRDCGAKRVIPTDNSLNTHAFLDADELHLD